MGNDIKYIFVGGCGRSGTTLVQKILVQNSQINGKAEFSHTKEIFEIYQRMERSFKNGYLVQVTNIEMLQRNFRLFYNSFFSDMNKEGIKYISEKTPNNIFVLNTLLELYKDSLFLYVYRDGRAVLNSHLNVKRRYKKQKKSARFNLISVCRLWNQSNAIYYRNRKTTNSNRILAIRYEELVSSTQIALEKLFNELGLEYKKNESSKVDEENDIAYINNIWYTKEMFNQDINTNNINKWKTELSFTQRILANSLMANNLKQMNYEVSPIYLRINSFIDFFGKEKLKKSFLYKYYLNLRHLFS